MSDRINKIKQLSKHLFTNHKLDLNYIGGMWLNVSMSELVSGRLKEGNELYKGMTLLGWDPSIPTCREEKGIPVVISARTVSLDLSSGSNKKRNFAEQVKSNISIDKLDCIYYIPAVLEYSGELKPCSWQWPWFDKVLSNESISSRYVEYINQRDGLISKIPDWKTWISLAFDLYQQVSGSSFQEKTLFGYNITDQVCVLPDNYVYKRLPLLNAYENIIEQNNIGNLTDYLLSEFEIADRSRFYPRGVDKAFAHSGHVDNARELPSSHRTVVEQMIKLEQDCLLGINSPLGTAPELCVLDTIASRMVNSAVLEEKPPLSAVLIDNLQELPVWEKYLQVQCDKTYTEHQEAMAILGNSWIGESGLITTAIVDDKERCQFDSNNVIITGVSTDRGLAELDNPRKIKELSAKVIEHCGKYFHEELPSLEKCRSRIHETLVSVDYARQSLLQTGIRIKKFVQSDAAGQDLLFFPEDELDKVIARRGELVKRLDEWAKHFKAVPFSLRIGANSDINKIKLKAYYEAFRNDEEVKILANIESYEDVEKGLSAYDKELAGQEAVLDEIVRQQDKTERMIKKLGKIGLDIEMIKKYVSQPDKINHELDRSLRLLAFWLAVHYYECRWLAGESIVLMHQKSRKDDHSANRYLDRLSLIAPFILIDAGTLIRLKGMKEKRLQDLYILNAQQIELAEVIPIIDYARRLYVFGDPAAGVNTDFVPLDKRWDKPKKNEKDITGINLSNNSNNEMDNIPGFVAPSPNGLGSGGGIIFNSDSSADDNVENNTDFRQYNPNLLSIVADRTKWFVAGRDGMWLFDNIRSYEEIVSFASLQWFNDKLKAVRGQAPFSGKHSVWLPMSLWQVDNKNALAAGFEFSQEKEIEEIIRWVKANYETLKTMYPDKAKDKLAVLAAPYTAQSVLLKNAMQKEFSHLAQAEIRVGSIDDFVPGETYPLVLYSGVFGGSDDGSKYVEDESLLYRAVSLAEDAFIYFGDINALPEKEGGSVSRLRRRLKPLNRKK